MAPLKRKSVEPMAAHLAPTVSAITQFDGPVITFDDGQRSHRGV
jgi:hypothetical protein